MDKVSIIIVSYNTKDITDRCLASIKEDAEIIVVDNASTDSSAEMITQKYPKAKLIVCKTNLGFTGGNNLGMAKANGDYFLLLNSDAFLEKDTLGKCLEHIAKFDVIGCKLTYDDGKLQPSAGYLPNPINTFLWVFGIDTLPIVKKLIPSVHPKYPEFFSKNRQVGWVTGAFMFLRREVYTKTGGFDEKYFMYTEEVDWCKRIINHGFKVWYVSDFSVVHLQGASQQNMNKALVREMQGMVYYFEKYYPQWPMRMIIKLGNFARVLAFKIMGQPKRAAVYKEIVRVI